eukprot:gene7592-biopygen15099
MGGKRPMGWQLASGMESSGMETCVIRGATVMRDGQGGVARPHSRGRLNKHRLWAAGLAGWASRLGRAGGSAGPAGPYGRFRVRAAGWRGRFGLGAGSPGHPAGAAASPPGPA